jgi:chromosome segregation ATPase
VVETIMIFALGFLAATLTALLIIPAINARAERLARRRAEALFPMSVSELTAEKDHLRAEFAVLQRRIERKADEAFAVKHQSMEELGRKAVRIVALEESIAERDRTIAELQNELAETRSSLAGTDNELATAIAALAGTRETLAAIEIAHRKTLDELVITRAEFERTKTSLADTRAELLLLQEKLEAKDAEHASLEGRHSGLLSELDTKRITISDLETRLATQTARGDEFDRALNDRRGELSDERQRLADFAKNLLAEQERSLLLEQRTRDLEAERDARAAEASALASRLEELTGMRTLLPSSRDDSTYPDLAKQPDSGPAGVEAVIGKISDVATPQPPSVIEGVEILKAEKASLEGALGVAREERARLQKELETFRRSASNNDVREENADLRKRIIEVADEIMRVASRKDPEPRKRRSNLR